MSLPSVTADHVVRAKRMIGCGLDVEEVSQWLANHDADKAELERLRTWGGLMELLDAHYPPDVAGGSSGDPGPRIVVLTREIERLQNSEEAAWGLIANAWDGDWNLAGEASGWKKAAGRWRDKYHKHLPQSTAERELDRGET